MSFGWAKIAAVVLTCGSSLHAEDPRIDRAIEMAREYGAKLATRECPTFEFEFRHGGGVPGGYVIGVDAWMTETAEEFDSIYSRAWGAPTPRDYERLQELRSFGGACFDFRSDAEDGRYRPSLRRAAISEFENGSGATVLFRELCVESDTDREEFDSEFREWVPSDLRDRALARRAR